MLVGFGVGGSGGRQNLGKVGCFVCDFILIIKPPEYEGRLFDPRSGLNI